MNYYQGDLDYLALCYAVQNRKTAEQIARLLQEQRVRVWSSDMGCNLKQDADAARFQKCRAAVILISAQWAADTLCRIQLQAAAALELDTVLVFLDETDLSKDEQLSALLRRSVRMTDYSAKEKNAFVEAFMPLLCVRDCLMAENEEPEKKKSGLFGLFK